MTRADQDLTTFFEVSLDMLCIRDDALNFVRANQAWQTVLGYSPEDLVGKPMLSFIHPDDHPSSKGHMERIRREDEVWNFVNRYRHRDGHYLNFEWRARRVGDRVFGVARDITERLIIEAQINEAKRAAEAANQAKTDFLANMSHEIRTPLNGVIGVADALARTALTPAQRDMVDLIQSSGVTLERLVSDILDVSKIEAGKLEIEVGVFDLRHGIEPILSVHRLRAQEKGLPLHTRFGDTARGQFQGDVTRILQVIGNLLSNAVKFTARGEVSLQVDMVEAALPGQPEQMIFEVRDSGVGFDPAFAATLFTRFSQADTTITRRFGGTGLGLSICRALVEMMGGEIVAESTPGRGSLFRVTLPLMRDRSLADYDAAYGARQEKLSDAHDADDGPLPNDSPLRVLLAEDHPINQQVIHLILAPYGSQITTVEDGAQALAAFAVDDYDLVLMDMQMPVMDGLAATRAIRDLEAQTARPRTAIIMLSANAMAQHRRDALDAGADLHVAKPITAASLIGGIGKVLEEATLAANDPDLASDSQTLAANDPDMEDAAEGASLTENETA